MCDRLDLYVLRCVLLSQIGEKKNIELLHFPTFFVESASLTKFQGRFPSLFPCM